MAEPDSQETELDISSYFEILLRRRWVALAVFLMVVVAAFLYAFTTRPLYQAATLVLIEKARADRVIYSDTNGMMWEDTEDFYPTQYKLLKSDSLVQQVYDQLDLGSTNDFKQPNGLEKLSKAISIAPVFHSRLVYVQVHSHDAALAATIANALAKAFVEHNLNNQLFMSKGVLQALQGGNVDRRIYDSLPAVVNNPLLQTLKAEYAKLQAQAADMSAKFTPRHPAVIAVKSNMAAVQSQIQAETDKIVQSLKTELSGQLAANNVRVIDPAQVPLFPISPKRKLALIIGALGGLLLGWLAAALVEAIDQSIRTQDDVEMKLDMPFLGAIPSIPVSSEKKVYETLVGDKISLTSEAFRNLRTMIDFAGVGEHSKKFLVTSTVQEEGKSYIASNLAVAFSQLGEKVLIIDGDLRRPKLHKNFWLSDQHGLSEFLAQGKSVDELSGLIQSTDIPGLKVMVCGTRPPNPSELLNTPKVAALVEWATSNFDRVLVDCTPMFPINDTLLWSRYIRSCVFAVRYGKTRSGIIRKACQKLGQSGVKVLGAAINGSTSGGIGYSHYGYYYQQYYHHYYQQEEQEMKKA